MRERCTLEFPWKREPKTLKIEMYFQTNQLDHAVAMADKVSAKLHEFETKGLQYQQANHIVSPTASEVN